MRKLFLFSFMFVFLVVAVEAQEKSKTATTEKTWFTIHEDVVIPSQNAKYTEALKKLKEACKQHNIPVTWTTVRHDDYSYIHLSPINKFGDLDKNQFDELSNKMGKEAYAKLMSGFNGCYTTHHDFVVEQLTSSSYMSPSQEENFRDILYWSVYPGKETEAEKIIAEWRKLYEAKEAPAGFLAFKIVYGEEPGFAIVSWGKDEVDAATKARKTNELIKADSEDLIKRTMAITAEMSHKRAWVLSDYSLMLAGSGGN